MSKWRSSCCKCCCCCCCCCPQEAKPTPPLDITNRIYIANFFPSEVRVIDGVTNNTIINIPSPSYVQGEFQNTNAAIAANSVTKKIYVTNDISGVLGPGLYVIDGKTNKIIKVFPEISFARSVAINPVTNRIYVSGRTQPTSDLIIIDGNTDTIIDAVNFTGGGRNALAVNSITNRIYGGFSVSVIDNIVSVVDGVTNKEIALIRLMATNPSDTTAPVIAVNEATNHIYATNPFDNTVSVIDGNTNTVTNTIQTGFFPRAIAVNSITNKVYVANMDESTISVIDGITNTVTDTISLVPFNFPSDIEVNPVTNRIYVITNSDRMITIDGVTNTIIDNTRVGTSTSTITLIP